MNYMRELVSTNLRWMGVHSEDYFVVFLGFGDVTRSWNFLGNYLFLVDCFISVQRFVQSLVVIAYSEWPFLSGLHTLLG